MQHLAFVAPATDQTQLLAGLQALGVVHLRSRPTDAPDDLATWQQGHKQIAEAVKVLEDQAAAPPAGVAEPFGTLEEALAMAQRVLELRTQQAQMAQEALLLRKQQQALAPWGNFSKDTLAELAAAGLFVRFFTCPSKAYQPAWLEKYPLQLISIHPPDAYLVAVDLHGEPLDLPLTEQPPPSHSPGELSQQLDALAAAQAHHAQTLGELANQLPRLRQALAAAGRQLEWTQAQQQVALAAGERVAVVEGFVPRERAEEIGRWAQTRGIVCLSDRPNPSEAMPPILLKNGAFARLFEPIGQLFSLPAYGELDLTPFFAPFFMLFFGFCLGDAGYGLVLWVGATVYGWRAGPAARPLVRLVQWLGAATILMGAVTGTLFGLSLLDAQFAWLGRAQTWMLDSNQTFQLALLVGLAQILFALGLQAYNRTRQYGWLYGLSVYGWIILILGIADVSVTHWTGPWGTYACWAGVGLILLFNDPRAAWYIRLGKGLWELYGITGFFGDLLSYIRLFALGISSAILGLVVNDIALQIRDGFGVLGPVLFVIFLLVGHGANLLIAALGSFVHPMRLTFVEFYKNAGFAGGGKPYRPFGGGASAGAYTPTDHDKI